MHNSEIGPIGTARVRPIMIPWIKILISTRHLVNMKIFLKRRLQEIPEGEPGSFRPVPTP
jgi:hypothetical protein